jgi:HK97 family phage prohead protease
LSALVIQGTATELDKPFAHGNDVMILKSGCFDSSMGSSDAIKLLLNHDFAHCLGSWPEQLLLYAGKKALVFRYLLPNSNQYRKTFEEMADDFLTYVPISIGFDRTKSETTKVDGVNVITVIEAKLNEVSILNKTPAVHSTYGRVVSWGTCGSLQEDCESGRFDLVGRAIGLHRAVKAQENGGKIEYQNATTPYERAADRFQYALANFAKH